jgi:molecular chaperone HscB
MLDFKQSYFELFGLPETFDIDFNQLGSSFRALQAKYHPDRFINADDKERLVAMQTTGLINEANETLKSSRLRARYLLKLKGVDFDDEVDTTSDGAFLMHQMEIREALEDVENAQDPLARIDDIGQEISGEADALKDDFVDQLEAENLDAAKEAVLKMKFFERLCQESKNLTEKLEDQLF